MTAQSKRALCAKTISMSVFLAVACLLPLASSIGQARPVIPVTKTTPEHRQTFDTTRFVPESDLKAGQVGYALTVFHGTNIEKFNIEILGVLQKVNNGKDLILIKVTSGPSVTRQANIAHGMSGSPVYIGKRMVGAIAYGLPFAREPIGLVTPIGDMLDSWDPDLPAKPSIGMTAASMGGISPVLVPASQLARFLAPGEINASPQATEEIEPMMTPVMVTGMNPSSLYKLNPILQPFGLMPVAGGGGSGGIGAPTKQEMASLVPGAAVGVSLVQGDVDMTAIGTLTYRDGNRVIAFGHPFTGIGPIDAAMTTATITDLFPSVQDSTKLGAPLQTVGRIFQDRPFSVGGIIGSMPQMIPVVVKINDESDNRQRTYTMRVINHPLLTGPLITQVVGESILEVHGTPGDAIASVTMDVDAEQLGHITRHNVFYDPLSINQTATSDLDNLLGLLSANPFYPLAVKSVTMDVDIRSQHETAQVDHIFVPREVYEPGDVIQVGVVLKPYKQESVVQIVPITIPMTTPDGSVTLNVRGGSSATSISTASLSGGGSDTIVIHSSSNTSIAANISQLVKKFLEEPKNNELVTSLELPTTALNVQGEKLSLLPPNLSAVMRGQHTSGLHSERDEVKDINPELYVVTGSATLVIKVARKNPLDTAGSTAPAVTSTVTTSTASIDVDGDYPATTAEVNPRFAAAGGTPRPAPLSPLAPAATPAPPIAPPGVAVAPSPDAATETDEDADDDTGDAKPDAKTVPVVRTASVWRQDSADDFASGKLDNVAITSADDLRPAASPKQLASTSANYVWSIVPDDTGDLFAGTGDDGSIYKVAKDGTVSKYASTGELEVTALARNPVTGDLYAGTAPHGIVFRIHDGAADKVFTAPEKYITALLLDTQRGKLYASTGGGTAKLYAADLGVGLNAPSSGPMDFEPVWSSQEAHILCLAIDSQGIVYAGTAPNGLVYAVPPDGKVRVVLDVPEPNIASLAIGKDDILYAGTSPKGMIYKVTQNIEAGTPDVKPLLPKSGPAVYALRTDHGGNLWAVAGNTLYSIAPDDTLASHTADPDVSFIALSLGDDGSVYAGTSDIGRIFDLNMATGQVATYTSAVHDAKRFSHWGNLSWTGRTPPGTTVTFATRSGNVAKPDSTWSEWTPVSGVGASHPILSPSARYLQYQATVPGTSGGMDNGARISSVSIYYMPRNQKPSVRLTAPSGGTALSGTYTLRWEGTDPDRDTLNYNLFYSKDGSTWTPIDMTAPTPVVPPTPTAATPGTLTPAAPTPSPSTITPPPPTAPSGSTQRTSKKPTSSATPPAPPAGMPQTSPNSAPQKSQNATPNADSDSQSTPSSSAIPSHTVDISSDTSTDTTAPDTSASPHRSTLFKWDTKQVPDGSYQIKVVADDSPSNAVDAQSAETVSEEVLVDNTAPVVTIDAATPLNGVIAVNGTAKGNLAAIKAVQYKIDNSPDWIAAAPSDGIFDTALERYTLTTATLPVGTHKITVEAINQAGLTGTATVEVTIRKVVVLNVDYVPPSMVLNGPQWWVSRL